MPYRSLLDRVSSWVRRAHLEDRGAVGWLILGVIIGIVLVIVLIVQLIIPGDGD